MSSLVQDDFIRATSFFALALGISAVGGVLLGDLRGGIEVGLGLGAVFAVFAYFFVAPTGEDMNGSPEAGDAPESDDANDE